MIASPPAWSPYCGVGPTPAEWLGRWNLDPVVIVLLAGAGAAVWLGARGMQRRCGLAACAVLAISFISPLCALSSALFAARTLHHVMLVAAAAPLIAWTLPRLRTGPLILPTLIQTAVFWAWHAPAAYGTALSHDAVYWLMQASLLGSAIWFWAGVRKAQAPAAVGALLVAMVQMGLLGALITFAGQPLYVPHLATTFAWGLSPLEDQQMAGLIMWAPAAGLYLAAALAILARRIGPPVVGAARTA